MRALAVFVALSFTLGGCSCGDKNVNRLTPVLTVDPPQLGFGDVTVGTTASATVTFSNTGSGTAQLSTFALSGSGAGAFSLSGAEAASLGASEERKVTVTFAPLAAGSFAASLVVTGEASNTSELTVGLSGGGRPGATRLAFIVQPSDVAAGALLVDLIVEAQDAAGAVVTDESRPVTLGFGSNPSSATLAGALTASFSAGRATFSGLSIARAGAGYTLVAAIAQGPSGVSVPFNVTAGAPAQLAFEVQPGNTVAGMTLAPPVVVAIQDASGNRITGAAPVPVALTLEADAGSLAGTLVQSALDGRATFNDLSVALASGGLRLRARANGLTDAVSAPFTVSVAGATRLRFVDQPQSTLAGVTLAPVSVRVEDGFGNLVTQSSAQVDLAVGGALASLLGTPSQRADAGIAVFADVRVERAGRGYLLEAASTSLPLATSSAFDIGAAALAGAPHTTFTASPASVVANGIAATTLTLVTRDAFDNPVVAVPVTIAPADVRDRIFPTSGFTDDAGTFVAAWSARFPGVKTANATAAALPLSAMAMFSGEVCAGPDLLPGPANVPVGASFLNPVATDMNGDGLTDFLWFAGTLRLALSQDGGDFLLSTPSPNAGLGLATGDFNRDGYADVAYASTAALNLLLGNGNGAFTLGSSLPPTGFVVAGQFNADTNLDMVMSDGGTTVGLYAGNGAGTFTGPTYYNTAGSGVAGLTAAELTNDGRPDLVVAKTAPIELTLHYQLAGGGFGAQLGHVPLSSAAKAVATGRLNADGFDDLVVLHAIGDGTVLLGQGDGGFAAPVALVLAGASRLELVDLDSDTHVDLVTAAGFDVVTRLGDGAGGFGAPRAFRIGDPVTSFAVGHLDRDGRLDVVVSETQPNGMLRFRGDGRGGFGVADTLGLGFKQRAVSTPDFDGDGVLDLVTAGQNEVRVLMGRRDGGFEPAYSYSSGGGLFYDATGQDATGDGVLDLLAANFSQGAVTLVPGLGDGGFGTPRTIASLGPLSVVARDFDNDLVPDLAWANFSGGTVAVAIGLGDGGFKAATNYPVGGQSWTVMAADLNRDTVLDLVVGNMTSGPKQFLGNGNGTFQAAVAIDTINAGDIDLGDVNDDALIDVVSLHRSASQLKVYLGQVDGGFSAAATFASVPFPVGVRLADLNNDRQLDALVTSESPLAAVALYRGIGDGGFLPFVLLPTDQVATEVHTVDLDGDGRLEVLTACGLNAVGSPANGALRVHWNRGCFFP